MTENRKINTAGFNLIKQFEGCRLQSYQDQHKIWTIGYGHVGPEATPYAMITQKEADDLLQQDLNKFYHLDQYLAEHVNDNQFSALVCLAFNIGLTALKLSSVIRRINGQEDPTDSWLEWCHIDGQFDPGLKRRRLAELKLFKTPC